MCGFQVSDFATSQASANTSDDFLVDPPGIADRTALPTNQWNWSDTNANLLASDMVFWNG
jgi:hypothetical protein